MNNRGRSRNICPQKFLFLLFLLFSTALFCGFEKFLSQALALELKIGKLSDLREAFASELGKFQRKSNFYLSCGAHVLRDDDGKRRYYSRLGFSPQYAYNEVDIQLDLSLNLDENGRIRKADWDRPHDYLRMIDSIKWREITDPVFFRIEQIPRISFGSGALISDYSSATRYPMYPKKLTGFVGWNSGYEDGLKAFTDNVINPHLMAARAFITPHDYLALGITGVADRAIPVGSNEEYLMGGSVDLTIPIKDSLDQGLALYGELGKFFDYGQGLHTGIRIREQGYNYKIEVRKFERDYIPQYFNRLYEMERSVKMAELRRRPSGGEIMGWYNELSTLITPDLELVLSYASAEKPYNDNHFRTDLLFTESTFKKVKLDIAYDSKKSYFRNLRDRDNLFSIALDYDISFQAKLRYGMSRIIMDDGSPANMIRLDTQLLF